MRTGTLDKMSLDDGVAHLGRGRTDDPAPAR